MKVKVGNKVYDAKDIPVMVILNVTDKFNIEHMSPEATKYAAFPSGSMSTQEMESWMEQEGCSRHTVEDDFEHFLHYTGFINKSKDVIELLRIAYEAAWD